MARIKTYIQDDNITNKDIVLGSDGDENNKTKNYTVQGLKNFITSDFEASEQDNIIKSYTLPAIDTPNTNLTVLEEAASLISNVSPSITVNADEILFFKLKRGDKFYVLSLKGLGKGVYGLNEIQVTKDNLQIISEKALVVENIVEDSTTDLINLGEIQPLNISEAVNAINPPIEIQALSEGFTVFKVTNNGAVESYLFQGDSGLTGFGEQQTELSDFNLVEETGVTEGFVDLSDTPTGYTGNQANVVKVNSSEDGLEFGTLDADEIDDAQTTNKFTTQTDIDRLANTSGTNTGDQDISGISANSGRIDDVLDALSGKVDSVNTQTGDVVLPVLQGTQYLYVQADGTDTENATELQNAYNTAKTMSPSATNRITVVAGIGNYDFGTSSFDMDTQYIDLVSLDGNKSVVFNHTLNALDRTEGSINITANDVFVKGVDVVDKNFTIGDNLNLLKVENCQGGSNSFGTIVEASGTFIGCVGGTNSFGGSGNASGVFKNCKGELGSFGAFGTASGFFNNCTSGDASFGGGSTLLREASGIFLNCQAGYESFGSGGQASGTFTNCIGGTESFGGDGNFQNNGVASGIFRNCQGDNGSFGGSNGTLTGKLYYCRLTSGTFETPSANGKIVLGIDGNDDVINLG